MIRFNLNFLGTTVVDKRFSNPMLPWVIADIKRRKKNQKVELKIENGEIIGVTNDVIVFCHQIQNLHRFFLEPQNARTFMYLMRDEFEPMLNVYLFEAAEYEDVMEIFQTFRESAKDQANLVPKSHSSAAALTSLCSDISPTNSQFFEVLYVGKMKVSHRKVPDTFIDDALERIKLYELERSKKHEAMNQSAEKAEKTKGLYHWNQNPSRKIDSSVTSDENSNEEQGKPYVKDLEGNSVGREEDDNNKTNKNDEAYNKENLNRNTAAALGASKNKSDEHSDEPKPEITYRRSRAASLGVIETFKKKVDDVNQNRTMLFYVGKSDLRLISPDRKQVLLHKMLKDINCCIQGIRNNQHFGFISRETDNYIGYVFKCESNSVADHIVSAISQSFHSMKESKERSKQPVLSCEHCPMMWYHKLCSEVEDQNEKKTQLTILKKIETLPEDEQIEIHTKFLGAESSNIKEQNEFLMILLRTHCERKQSRHIHDTEETRSEFLNQVLGGNTIFMKAKRSLTSSFDQLLKRKGTHMDGFHSKESPSQRSDSTIHENSIHDEYHRPYMTVGPADGEIMKKEISKQMNIKLKNKNALQTVKRSNLEEGGSLKNTNSEENLVPGTPKSVPGSDLSLSKEMDEEADSSKTPLMNIFLKVGSASKATPPENAMQAEMSEMPSGSWRQAIFNRVVTPGKIDESDGKKSEKKTKEELRELWRTAINQQILLIRMEKENARLRARQEEATVKRIKLEYDELGNFTKESIGIWDMICNKDNRISSKCDSKVLLQAVGHGVPRAKRGDVWSHFAFQCCLKQSPFDSSDFPNFDVPYEDLLKQLTSFQHAILIDLGRTFPNHPYFSSPLGPGQLALFNLLKAYSLLDPYVGYCQGLSFVAGVLLLHMSEDMAFSLLKHLMFRRGLRNQYLPDMAALQVKLYQLSRLIHDTLPKLYAHFDRNEIAPTLYATSWMLTLFASQFQLGFVSRVFDLLFAEQTTDVLFRVIMALLEEHKFALLNLTSFEEIMDYLKIDISKMDAACLDRIMKRVLSMDISKQLHEFEVEYHVLQEEMSTPRVDLDQLRKVEAENKNLKNQNLVLQEQMEALNKNLSRLEKFRSTQQCTINKLETKVKTLETTVKFLGDFISEMSSKHKEIDLPGEVRRIIANLESSQESANVKTISKKPFDKTTLFRKIQSSIDFHEKPHFSEFFNSDSLPQGTKYDNKSEKSNGHSKPVIKAVPLKVISDDEKFEYHPSSNLTSKFTSGVSSFFQSSHNNQKNPKSTSGLSTMSTSNAAENTWTKHNFSGDIGSLNIKESAIRSQRKDGLTNNGETNYPNNQTISSKPSSVADASIKESINPLHPLDSSSNGVNITFNGTTKLKSIKSRQELFRSNTIDVIQLNNKLLHISEDGDS